MLHLPAIRWGKPYESLDVDQLIHFLTGEPVVKVSQSNAGLLQRDMRKAAQARNAVRYSPRRIDRQGRKGGGSLLNATLPVGDGQQSPEDFYRCQSATTGLPEHICKFNMTKNHFVLSNMRKMLDALTRGLPLSVLTRGYGVESRGVVVSYQAQAPVLGLVLPSNSPGVHTLWLPVIPMQIGLVMKPGQQEPWTPYRMTAAFVQAGIPAEAISIYPGAGADIGAALLNACQRAKIFGGQATVEKYHGNPRVQVHGPGWSKILLGDDVVDNWEQYFDLMVESVYANCGRGCINTSSIWASRHTKEIAAALAQRLGPIEVKPPTDPEAGLAAFTIPGSAATIWKSLEADFQEAGVTHVTAEYGPRLVELERCAYLRPTVVHSASPTAAVVKKEFMYPFTSVVECPQDKMLEAIGPTLVCTALTNNAKWQQELTDATQIDRLNIGPIPTTRLDWLQPHEGNIVEFLYRARAYQLPKERLAAL